MRMVFKNMWKQLPSPGLVLHRFPVAALTMAIFTFITILNEPLRFDDPLSYALIGLVVGAYLSVIITLAAEVMKTKRFYIVQVLCVIIITVIFWYSKNLRLNIFMALGGVLLMLGNAAGWGQGRDDLHIWDFTHKLWTSAVLAAVGSFIFLMGILSIQFALKTLLGVDINQLTEGLIIPLGLGLLAPLYWMSTLPPVNEPYYELYDNPGFVSRAIGFLGTWLLAPLSLIYAVIVLIYGAKILMTMSLPKGEIAQLTLPFLLIGTLTWLLLEPPFIQKTALARWFRWLWFPVSLPVTLLLGIAVAVRISIYGYTESRFALAIVVVWAFAVGLWFTLSKSHKRDIRLIPGIAAGLLIAGTFMAQPISINSQTLRAKKIVAELGLMSETGDIMSIASPNLEQKKQLQGLKGKLKYLYGKKTLRSIKRVFPAANAAALKDEGQLYEQLNITNIPSRNGLDTPVIDYDNTERLMSVSGFDYVSRRFSYFPSNRSSPRDLLPSDLDISIQLKGPELSVTHLDGLVAKINLDEAVTQLKPDYDSPLFIDIDERTRIYFESFNMKYDAKGTEPLLTYVGFRVMLKDAT